MKIKVCLYVTPCLLVIEGQYREGARGGGNESLWNMFLGVVSDEK